MPCSIDSKYSFLNNKKKEWYSFKKKVYIISRFHTRVLFIQIKICEVFKQFLRFLKILYIRFLQQYKRRMSMLGYILLYYLYSI